MCDFFIWTLEMAKHFLSNTNFKKDVNYAVISIISRVPILFNKLLNWIKLL
jgi:hypothetical protein